MASVAILDADVLYQVRVRVLLLQAARYGLFRPTWSEHILAEVRKALTNTGKLTTEQIDRAVSRLREENEAALVSGYEALVPAMKCHPDDRHVLAVAVYAGAETLVTWNAADFPREACEPYAIEVQSPDKFLSTPLTKSLSGCLRS